jgi:5'-nucleotidase
MLDVIPPRTGAWMQTFTGRSFWPADPRPEDIDIVDIAHALSMQPRYGGHCTRFYSVAEHSRLVSEQVELRYGKPGLERAALLHDASEAYLVDIPRPVKVSLSNYKELEARLDVDNAILSDERHQVMRKTDVPDNEWGCLLPPLGVIVPCDEPHVARHLFMQRFHDLFA